MKNDPDFYLTELMGQKCRCGRKKESKKSFCYHCYKLLTKTLQQQLYLPLGNGYEEAYDLATTQIDQRRKNLQWS